MRYNDSIQFNYAFLLRLFCAECTNSKTQEQAESQNVSTNSLQLSSTEIGRQGEHHYYVGYASKNRCVFKSLRKHSMLAILISRGKSFHTLGADMGLTMCKAIIKSNESKQLEWLVLNYYSHIIMTDLFSRGTSPLCIREYHFPLHQHHLLPWNIHFHTQVIVNDLWALKFITATKIIKCYLISSWLSVPFQYVHLFHIHKNILPIR